jgi:hypothetical protein
LSAAPARDEALVDLEHRIRARPLRACSNMDAVRLDGEPFDDERLGEQRSLPAAGLSSLTEGLLERAGDGLDAKCVRGVRMDSRLVHEITLVVRGEDPRRADPPLRRCGDSSASLDTARRARAFSARHRLDRGSGVCARCARVRRKGRYRCVVIRPRRDGGRSRGRRRGRRAGGRASGARRRRRRAADCEPCRDRHTPRRRTCCVARWTHSSSYGLKRDALPRGG